MQLGPPTVTLNEDGGAQEGCATESPDEGAEHERELQSPELGQEGWGPAPAEAVGDLWGDEETETRRVSHRESPKLQKNKEAGSREGRMSGP